MRNVLAIASAAGLLGAAGLVGWTVLSRPSDRYSARSSGGLDQSGAFFARREPPELFRDAVAAPPPPIAPSPRPVPAAEMRAATRAAKPAPPPAVDGRKAERWARGQSALRSLLRAPAGFLLSRSALRAPAALRRFLDDKRAVESYLSSPLVRAALVSPAVAKAVLGNPAVAGAVLTAPAMRDPEAVRALLGSRLLRKVLDCPGVQAALEDRRLIESVAADPRVGRWLAENPQALRALAQAAPALAGLTGRSR